VIRDHATEIGAGALRILLGQQEPLDLGCPEGSNRKRGDIAITTPRRRSVPATAWTIQAEMRSTSAAGSRSRT
jgi:hypothetical protein